MSMQESDAAKGEYKKRREAAGFERDAVLGLLDLDLFNVPTSESKPSAISMVVCACYELSVLTQEPGLMAHGRCMSMIVCHSLYASAALKSKLWHVLQRTASCTYTWG